MSFKIADFGLACDLEIEALGKRCGSAGFMAPEIIFNRDQSPKVDLFSVGVILHILLSGISPFKGTTEIAVLKANAECKVTLSRTYWQHINDLAKDFVLKLMSKNEVERPGLDEILKHPWLKPHVTVEVVSLELLTEIESQLPSSHQVFSVNCDEALAESYKKKPSNDNRIVGEECQDEVSQFENYLHPSSPTKHVRSASYYAGAPNPIEAPLISALRKCASQKVAVDFTIA
mmetsp:Transcript_23502/g.41652  ORF Transcript_23502/g.41652 Transcript_23502/m.41652 type:complete len:232 (+) Transcript_23502:933-1628(+)